MRLHRRVFTAVVVSLMTPALFSQTHIHREVDELILAGRLDEAEKKAEENLRKYPGNPEAVCALACVYRNRARKSLLRIDLAKAGIKEGESGSYPLKGADDIGTVFSEAYTYDRQSYARAEALYFEIIEMDPHYHNAYFNLLNDYLEMEEFGNYFKVLDAFIANLKDRDDTPDYLLDLGSKLMQGNRLDEALELYRRVADGFPGRIEAKSDMGAVYFRKGEIPRALGVFSMVFEIDGDDRINLDNYILAALLTEDFETVFDLYGRKISLEPESHGCLFDRGLAALLLGREYRPCFEAFVEKQKKASRDPENDFWLHHAAAILNVENKEEEEKIRYFEFLSAEFHRGGMLGQALMTSNIVEKLRPTDAALMIQASIFDRFNFYDKTMECLDALSERRKTNAAVISEYDLNFNYGRIHYVSGRYGAAIPYLRTCFRIDGKNALLNHLLGLCCLKAGDRGEAVRYFTINKEMEDAAQLEYINLSIRELGKLDAGN